MAVFRIRGPSKAAQIPDEENGSWGGGMEGGGRESKVSARSATQSMSWHQMLGKMPLTKKAQEKSFKSIQQSLMAGPNCQVGRGKDGAAVNLG
jgi:hypothetical protein